MMASYLSPIFRDSTCFFFFEMVAFLGMAVFGLDERMWCFVMMLSIYSFVVEFCYCSSGDFWG